MNTLKRVLFTVALFAIVTLGRAATFCVPQDIDLASALAAAQANSDTSNYIHIQAPAPVMISGSTGADGPAYSDPGSSLRVLDIQGGFDVSCDTSSSYGVLSTIDGGGNTNLLHINAPNTLVSIENIAFTHANTKTQSGIASAVHVVAQGVQINWNSFIDNQSLYFTTLYARSSGNGQIFLGNNLFTGNSGYRFGAGIITSDHGGVVVDNTITGNTASNLDLDKAYSLYLTAAAPANNYYIVANNILWGTTGASGMPYDLSSTVLLEAHNNDIGAYDGAAWSVSSANNLSVDPDFAAGSFQLAPGSPLINAGDDNPMGGPPPSDYGTDLAGQPRLIGQHIDIGAYESDVLFANGFQ